MHGRDSVPCLLVFRPVRLSWHRRLRRTVARAWTSSDDSAFWTAVALILAVACAVMIFIAAMLEPTRAAGGWWP